ncbi:MAG: hypothetical protein CR997_05085 [Acidobacteria bacterium]|nr:MAG: hypothetical protein CR997_05085 [Acidobacteriota bacterium]
MLKNMIVSLLIFGWLSIAGLAQEIVIENASVISTGNKTTLAIDYAGAGKIQFFAVQEDDSLVVDLPGVLSKVDFSTIHFDQVKAVKQSALDPDSQRGISVRFKLAENVEYHFFDGDAGSMILFFSTVNPEPGSSQQAAEDSASDEMETASNSRDASVSGSQETVYAYGTTQKVLQGREGDKDLNSVDIVVQSSGIQLEINADGLERYKYFYLTGPDRYVLDLYGVNCRLDEDEYRFDSSYVERIRVKQNQVHPEPITRIVLDLKQPVEVLLNEDSTQLLATIGEVQPLEHAAGSTLAEHQSVSVAELDTPAVEQETMSETVALETAPVPEPVQETLPVSSLTDPVIDSQTEVVTQQTTPVASEHGTQEREEMMAPEVVDVEQSENDTQSVAVTQVNQESALPAVSFSEETVKEAEEVKPDASPVVTTQYEEQADPALKTEEPKKGHQLPFIIATDLDEELESFIRDEKRTFYSEMKDTKPLKPQNNHIVVTNNTINAAMDLTESNALQEEDELKSSFESSSLFVEEQEAASSDMIVGNTSKYRGFEIQGIDVVDVNVTDLLRFFADQVGFNLYVDPSVKNLKATYKFSNIPWDQAMEIILRNAGLDYQYDNGVLRVATTEKFREEAEAARQLRIEQELSVPPETYTFHLSYAKVSEISPIVQQYLSPRGSLLMDERTNTLIIEDIPKKIIAIRSLINKLDTQVPQVIIESRVVETTKRFIRELGVQWGLSGLYAPEYGTQTGMTFPSRVTVGGPKLGTRTNGVEGGYAVNFPIIAEDPAGFGFSLGNILDTFKLDLSLQMIEEDGLGQIISAPKVTTQNNKTALIQNGQRIPVQTVQRGTITVRYINAVLELEVTPHITSDKTIIMDLVVDKSEPDFTRDVLGNPIINIRKAETRVLVKDGGTAVIGGIYVMNEQERSSGIPGLKKVPYIRRLFGSESMEVTNQELLIFVTPRIVKY